MAKVLTLDEVDLDGWAPSIVIEGKLYQQIGPLRPGEQQAEGFAQLYSDAADLILAQDAGDTEKVAASLLPGIADGLDGMRFINGAIASHKAGTWLAREDWA